mmetsp:Transcript_14945/g.41611  ORF Transcript_14945/g.41611 Transcript_14945/m.41611 type:complete len:149 (+) Transcript_14945:165-611(+)
MKSYILSFVTLLSLSECASSFRSSFVSSSQNGLRTTRNDSTLKMVDTNVAIGAAIGIGGFAFGIGMVSFAEAQGERSKERGGGLSDSMSTQLTGMLMEDVEVSSVEDLGSLTSQLEEALKKSGGAKEDEFEMTPEEIKRLEEEADDGW